MKKLFTALGLCLLLPQLVAAPGCALEVSMPAAFFAAGGGTAAVHPVIGPPYTITDSTPFGMSDGDLLEITLPYTWQCHQEQIATWTAWECGTNGPPNNLYAIGLKSGIWKAHIICLCPNGGSIVTIQFDQGIYCGPPPPP